MKEQIHNKINQISGLGERALLKSVIEQLFCSVYDHSEHMYELLENRVLEEMECHSEKYNIYTSIVKRSAYDPIHEYLFPIKQEDVSATIINLSEVLESLKESKKKYIFSVFFECDYLILREILAQKRLFKGTVTTNQQNYVAYFSLEQDRSYENELEALYKLFIDNNRPWCTVNAPYMNKIVKVYLDSFEDEIGEDEEIKEVIIDFAEYVSYIRYDMIPVWNVRHMKLAGMGFAMPCEEHLSYEHKISLAETGHEEGYLVEPSNQAVLSVRMTSEYLYIMSDTEESSEWKICQIVSPKKRKLRTEYYEMVSNAKKQYFLDNVVRRLTYPIKTKADIMRVFNSFQASDQIELETMQIREESQLDNNETYDLNSFIIDEIRDPNATKVLEIHFSTKSAATFITRDIVSFIISEIQYYYPEYKCKGRLL